MKALVYTRPGVLEYRDEPDPTPAPGEALIEVEAVGICGSDLHGYQGHDPRRAPPLILGHEICGRVREAIRARIDMIPEGARTLGLAPSLLELCRQADEYGPLLQTSRQRDDLLAFATGLLQQKNNGPSALDGPFVGF